MIESCLIDFLLDNNLIMVCSFDSIMNYFKDTNSFDSIVNYFKETNSFDSTVNYFKETNSFDSTVNYFKEANSFVLDFNYRSEKPCTLLLKFRMNFVCSHSLALNFISLGLDFINLGLNFDLALSPKSADYHFQTNHYSRSLCRFEQLEPYLSV